MHRLRKVGGKKKKEATRVFFFGEKISLSVSLSLSVCLSFSLSLSLSLSLFATERNNILGKGQTGLVVL